MELRGVKVRRLFTLRTQPTSTLIQTFANTDALEADTQVYTARTSANPKPSVWTKSANAILAIVARCCQRTSNSDH